MRTQPSALLLFAMIFCYVFTSFVEINFDSHINTKDFMFTHIETGEYCVSVTTNMVDDDFMRICHPIVRRRSLQSLYATSPDETNMRCVNAHSLYICRKSRHNENVSEFVGGVNSAAPNHLPCDAAYALDIHIFLRQMCAH